MKYTPISLECIGFARRVVDNETIDALPGIHSEQKKERAYFSTRVVVTIVVPRAVCRFPHSVKLFRSSSFGVRCTDANRESRFKQSCTDNITTRVHDETRNYRGIGTKTYRRA